MESAETSQSIPPDVYDRDYFLSEICEGWEEYQAGEVSFNKRKQVRLLAPRPGMRILDAGCGRGEVALACARAGAEVCGIDYSADAVEITRETLSDYPDSDIRVGDVTNLPWPDATFDRIQFSDVIEHLDPPQTVPAFAEFRRVLKPGGFALVHTAPNRLFMDYTWPAIRPFLRLTGNGEVVERVDEFFRLGEKYHVNEQSLYSMRRNLRAAGFENPRVWIDPDVLRSNRYHLIEGLEGAPVGIAARIAALRPVRVLFGNDVFAIATR
jgi:ubiquinone/menaquinone biosynthesis C-methylase UbiE